LDNLDVNALN